MKTIHKLVVALSLSGFLLGISSQTAFACSDHTKPIAVGSVDGFQSLANPTNTAALRDSCKVSLYLHTYIWSRLNNGMRRKIFSVFKGTGPEMLELNETPRPERLFGSYYQNNYRDLGVVAHIASVNGPNRLSLPQWKAYVHAARADGVRIVAPDFAPNTSQEWHNGQVGLHVWNQSKRRALIGGDLAIDAPPAFFLRNTFFRSAHAYQHFIVHEIHWANRHHLPSILILSPNIAGRRFLSDTQLMIAYLKRHNAIPTHYVVENYFPLPWPKDFINLVGSENNPNSVTGVALWMTRLIPNPPAQ
jgi:hypothetical protein